MGVAATHLARGLSTTTTRSAPFSLAETAAARAALPAPTTMTSYWFILFSPDGDYFDEDRRQCGDLGGGMAFEPQHCVANALGFASGIDIVAEARNFLDTLARPKRARRPAVDADMRNRLRPTLRVMRTPPEK